MQELSRVQPSAVDLEEIVLGGLLIDKEAALNVLGILRSDHFYNSNNQLVYKAIEELFADGRPIDLITVTNQLRKNGNIDIVGGSFFVANLTSRVGSSANIEHYARIISEKHIRRKLIDISSHITHNSYNDTVDTFELLSYAETTLLGVSESNIKKGVETIDSVLRKAIHQLEKANAGVSYGVPSGFRELDEITSGWQKGSLVILAARPAMGKSAYALSLARNAAVDHKLPVAIFSLEMTEIELANRMMMSEADLDGEKIKRGSLNPVEMQMLPSKIAALEKAPLFIDSTSSLSIHEFRSKVRKLKYQHDIKLVIIDYLQLMTMGVDKKIGNREQEISHISRSIKSLAKELDIPIIALSQLSRSVESRGGDKKPMLSDLRESGAIEQDADMVMFLYRPEYYGFTEDETGNSLRGIAEVIIAKHRSGSVGNIKLKFIADRTKFEDLNTTQVNVITPLASSNEFDSFETSTVSSNEWF